MFVQILPNKAIFILPKVVIAITMKNCKVFIAVHDNNKTEINYFIVKYRLINCIDKY